MSLLLDSGTVTVVEGDEIQVLVEPAEVVDVTLPQEEVLVISEAQGPPGQAGPPGGPGPRGPQGEPGPPGETVEAQDAYYVHHQSIPSASWTVNHNLLKRPAVTVTDAAGTAVMAEIKYVDDMTCLVVLAISLNGQAVCS